MATKRFIEVEILQYDGTVRSSVRAVHHYEAPTGKPSFVRRLACEPVPVLYEGEEIYYPPRLGRPPLIFRRLYAQEDR